MNNLSNTNNEKSPRLCWGAHKRPILIIILIAILAFTNSLFNDFVGDDYSLLINNTFYESWKNFPRIFDKSYLSPGNYAYAPREKSNSGSAAYRPVLSTTYFIDHWLWKKNAFGYHLTNLILHIANTLLAYFILFVISKNKSISLFGAILFCVHPAKVEAVCAIGYRADCLAAFFALLSFLLYIQNSFSGTSSCKNKIRLSLLFYFLAVFSKEAAVVLPFTLVAYDVYFRKCRLPDLLSHFKNHYLGYLIIATFYLFVYLKVFPNTTLDKVGLLGGTITNHALTILRIFYLQIYSLAIPFHVTAVPPQYTPPLLPWGNYQMWLTIIIPFFYVFMTGRMYFYSKAISFLMLWFLIFYIPVSNIIPLANPLSHRFLYLPSLGFLGAAAMLIHDFCRKGRWSRYRHLIVKSLKWGIITFCLFLTILLNSFWKNNFKIVRLMVKNYPSHMKSCELLSAIYFQSGLCPEAQKVLHRCLCLNPPSAKVHYMLGACSMDKFEFAKLHFHKAIALVPSYVAAYEKLGELFLDNGDYENAFSCFSKSYLLQNKNATVEEIANAYAQWKQEK